MMSDYLIPASSPSDEQLGADDEYTPQRMGKDYRADPVRDLFNETRIIPHATSGMQALSYIAGTSQNVKHQNYRATDYILQATNIQETDPAVFISLERKAFSAQDVLLKWCSKDAHFKKKCETFTSGFPKAKGSEARSMMEQLLETIIRGHMCSIELAVKCVLELTTRNSREQQNQAGAIKANHKGNAIMMFNEAYLEVSTLDYEETFRRRCIDRTLDVSLCDFDETCPAETLPGYERLTHAHSAIRSTVWSWYFIDICSYVSGGLQKDAINLAAELATYYISLFSKEHGLLMSVQDSGEKRWPRNESIRSRTSWVCLGLRSVIMTVLGIQSALWLLISRASGTRTSNTRPVYPLVL